MARQPTPGELRYQQQAISEFPFERVETTGEQALRAWEELRISGRGVPVVLGGDEEFPNLMEPFYPSSLPRRSAVEILDVAAGTTHPEDLVRERAMGQARATDWLTQLQEQGKLQAPGTPQVESPILALLESYGGKAEELTLADIIRQGQREPEVGEWPAALPSPPSPPVSTRFGQPLAKCHVALLPTDDWTTVPAHLLWGGWNDCPKPEYHVAALRSWRDRFGAELVGLGHDTMHIRVARRPQTQAAALELAREHYLYCSDIVDQGTGTLAPLAAELMASDWWFFWWD